MKRQITVHECDRCGATFNSQRDVALTVHTSRSGVGGGHPTSERLELCDKCCHAYERYLAGENPSPHAHIGFTSEQGAHSNRLTPHAGGRYPAREDQKEQ